MAPVPNLVQEENLRMHLCGPDIVSVQVLPRNSESTTCGIKKLELRKIAAVVRPLAAWLKLLYTISP